MNRLMELLRRAALIYQTEGLLPLAKKAASYAAGWLFRYETYYLYEKDSRTCIRRSDNDFMTKVDGWSFKVIYTNQEADELEANGFQFRKYTYDARSKLDKGAVAFCVFVGHELATVGWLCPTPQAKDSLNEPPAMVDFSNGEACGGGVWTSPKYRRMGLSIYCGIKRDEWWLEKGIVKMKWAVSKRNVAATTAGTKVGDLIYGEGRLVKVLWWKHWRERPLPSAFDMSDVVK